jgi:hypothetical protein
VPDDPHALTRARQLWDEGDRAAALALLKERVRADPTDGASRLALAELYRELIAPDQAGRWGITVPGWTTEVERDRLARMIAHSGIADHEIPECAIASPPAPPARTTRWERKVARQAAERAERGAMQSTVLDVVGAATDHSWWIIGIVFVLGVVIVWVNALFGQPVTALARWAGTATLATVAAACLARAPVLRSDERARRRRYPDTDPVDVDVTPWISGGIHHPHVPMNRP